MTVASRIMRPFGAKLGDSSLSLSVITCVCRLGRACAGDLARALDWSEPRATEALESLTHHRLVRPEGDLRYPLLVA